MVKKSFLILTILFLLPIISAVEFDMKTEFDQGETLIAKVSGNFLEPILKENIFFYRGHVRIPIEYDVAKINEEFYIYALLSGKIQSNYSIEIKDVRYMKGAEISEEDIIKEFSITNNTADFSVNPGFIITKEDFFIEVQNLQDKKINITIKDEDISLTLKSGEIKKINFELNEIEEPVFKTAELSSENLNYEIPVYLFLDKEPVKKEKKFKFEPSKLEISMSTDSETKRIIYLYNIGEETLENLSLYISDSLMPYVLFSLEEFEELEPDSNIKLEIYFTSDSEEKIIEGRITAEEENLYAYSDITLTFIEDYIPLNDEESEPIQTTQTCEEMQGVICQEGEECDEELVYAKDDVCCLGTCKKTEKSSTGKIIGWAIIGIVLVFLIWFFKKRYRGAKRGVDLFKIAKGGK